MSPEKKKVVIFREKLFTVSYYLYSKANDSILRLMSSHIQQPSFLPPFLLRLMHAKKQVDSFMAKEEEDTPSSPLMEWQIAARKFALTRRLRAQDTKARRKF